MGARISTGGQSRPLRRRDGRQSAQHHQVFSGRAMLQQFFDIGHFTLIQEFFAQTGVHTIDTNNDELAFWFTFHASLSFVKMLEQFVVLMLPIILLHFYQALAFATDNIQRTKKAPPKI